jgi:hypothetical protein
VPSILISQIPDPHLPTFFVSSTLLQLHSFILLVTCILFISFDDVRWHLLLLVIFSAWFPHTTTSFNGGYITTTNLACLADCCSVYAIQIETRGSRLQRFDVLVIIFDALTKTDQTGCSHCEIISTPRIQRTLTNHGRQKRHIRRATGKLCSNSPNMKYKNSRKHVLF